MPITMMTQAGQWPPSHVEQEPLQLAGNTRITSGWLQQQQTAWQGTGLAALTDDELAVQALISQRQGRIISTVLRAQSKYLLSCFAHPWNLLGTWMCLCLRAREADAGGVRKRLLHPDPSGGIAAAKPFTLAHFSEIFMPDHPLLFTSVPPLLPHPGLPYQTVFAI